MIIIVKKKQKTLKINEINKTVCFHVNPLKGHFIKTYLHRPINILKFLTRGRIQILT